MRILPDIHLRVRISQVFAIVAILATICGAQTNPQKVPQPPTDELRKFDPFLGNYEVSGDYAKLPWSGTLEWKTVIKGWYVRQIIAIKSPGIDREFWILATWDNKAQKYRLWGFQTLPAQIEGEVRFEADEMITEFDLVKADGQKARSSNRYKLIGKDELEVISYQQVGNSPPEKIGALRGKRITEPEATVSSAEHRWEEALRQFDAEAMQSLLAEDDLQTDFRGVVQDKTSWMQDLKRVAANVHSGQTAWKMSFDDEKVRIYGDVAVVTGRGTFNGHRNGKDVTHIIRFTNVWVNRHGAWQLVNYQATPIEAQ